MTIGERILSLMEEKGMTQTQLSKMTGIAQNTISDWRRKKTNPSSDKIMTICDILDVTPYELLQGTVRVNNASHDYLYSREGTEEYELLVMFDNLAKGQRKRVLGYVEALSGKADDMDSCIFKREGEGH